MDITFLQIVGAALIYIGGYTLVKGEIEWSFTAGPGTGNRGGMHIDLTPDSYKYKRTGVYSGQLLKPIAAMVCLLGALLIFIFPGSDIAFSI